MNCIPGNADRQTSQKREVPCGQNSMHKIVEAGTSQVCLSKRYLGECNQRWVKKKLDREKKLPVRKM